MRRTLPLALLVVLAGVVAMGFPPGQPAHAQDAPDPAELLRPWLRSQVVRGADVVRVTLLEQAEYVVDGPFGARRVRLEARLSGEPDGEGLEREYLSYTVNGRPAPPERAEGPGRRRRGVAGPPLDRILRAAHVGPRVLARMHTVGSAADDTVEGAPAWRVELVAREAQLPIERLTLWMDRPGRRLLRARTLLRRHGNDDPVVVTTDYRRVDGLDVPDRRHIEGTVQHRRRMRTFTMLFTYDGRYGDYRFDRE